MWVTVVFFHGSRVLVIWSVGDVQCASMGCLLAMSLEGSSCFRGRAVVGGGIVGYVCSS